MHHRQPMIYIYTYILLYTFTARVCMNFLNVNCYFSFSNKFNLLKRTLALQ